MDAVQVVLQGLCSAAASKQLTPGVCEGLMEYAVPPGSSGPAACTSGGWVSQSREGGRLEESLLHACCTHGSWAPSGRTGPVSSRRAPGPSCWLAVTPTAVSKQAQVQTPWALQWPATAAAAFWRRLGRREGQRAMSHSYQGLVVLKLQPQGVRPGVPVLSVLAPVEQLPEAMAV